MLEKLIFEIGGFFSGYKQVKIWFENGKMLKVYKGDFDKLNLEYVGEVEAKEQLFLESSLAKIRINSWKKEYVDPDVRDGTQWELEYKEQGKRGRHIYGSNDYPECWNDFIETIGIVVPEIMNEIIDE